MREAKKIIYFGLVIAVAVLLCLQAGALTVIKTDKTIIQPLGKNSLTFKNAEKIPLEVRKLSENLGATGLPGNVLVSVGSTYDDCLPGVSRDPSGNIVVAFTTEVSVLNMELGWGLSSDAGATWTTYGTTAGGVTTYNDIAWVNGPVYYGMFGVYIDPVEEQEGFYLAEDTTDPSTWVFYTWTGDAFDPTYACISDNSYLEGQYHDMDGPANAYIEHLISSGYDIPGCYNQMITGFDENGEILGGESTFDGQRDLDTAPAYDPDMSNEYMKSHHTWHCDPEENQQYKIVWKKIIPIEGDTDSTDIEYTPYQQYLDDGKHPNIGHSGNNVVVVYMNQDPSMGDWNIKCAYSNNDGDTWETTTVAAEPLIDETYPAVYMSGSSAYCAYVKQGNLYLIESNDGGATWGTPEQVNDEPGTVVEEENTVDIHTAGIVWTDDRNGDKDIYFATGAAAPEISIKSISGGLGISAEIENIGTADATNVQWSINLEGLVFPKSKTGTIPTLAAGDSETVKTGIVFGLGPIVINVAANGKTRTAGGTIILIFVTGVS
jgi:hypothetical protein